MTPILLFPIVDFRSKVKSELKNLLVVGQGRGPKFGGLEKREKFITFYGLKLGPRSWSQKMPHNMGFIFGIDTMGLRTP